MPSGSGSIANSGASIGGSETKTLLVYDEPFWRPDGLSGQTAGPGTAA